MKRKLSVILAMLMIFTIGLAGCGDKRDSIFSRPVVQRVQGVKTEWNDVSSFMCYYGPFAEEQKLFDVAIMHSNTLFSDADAKAKVKALSDAGTYVIAYITVGEDDSLNVADGLGEGGLASYYIYENGFPKANANWGSYFVDAGNPVWQNKIIEKAGEILDYGVDGLFMDTLDTVDIASDTAGGMIELVKKLKATYPAAKLVANRGFTVLPHISQYLSGVMFESFNTTYNFDLGMVTDLEENDVEYNRNVACNTINKVRQYDYFPVFCLDYVNEFEYNLMPQEYYNNSWEFDFIPYNTYDIDLATPCVPYSMNGKRIQPTSKRGEKALAYVSDGGTLGESNADTTPANLAYKNNGAVITVDSVFPGYSKNALNDGWYATPANHNQLNWSKESWASADNKNADHYIEVEFTENKNVSKVNVYWANDNGTYYSPQEWLVQAFIDGEWIEVAKWTNDPVDSGSDYQAFLESSSLSFTTVSAKKIRIVQPKGKGARDKFNDEVRAGLMWVSEVEIY